MSWIAHGPAEGTYSPHGSNNLLSMNGTHSEITFWQNRNNFTNYFQGIHLVSLNLTGEGIDEFGNFHAPEYSNLSIFYSLGYDLDLLNFIHIQPYFSYGIGNVKYRKNYRDSTGLEKYYNEHNETADWGIYGLNFIFEITGKFWIGYGFNYYLEKQNIEYNRNRSEINLEKSHSVLLVWNWERVKIKTINPRESWSFR